jgi:hypothetical protein
MRVLLPIFRAQARGWGAEHAQAEHQRIVAWDAAAQLQVHGEQLGRYIRKFNIIHCFCRKRSP